MILNIVSYNVSKQQQLLDLAVQSLYKRNNRILLLQETENLKIKKKFRDFFIPSGNLQKLSKLTILMSSNLVQKSQNIYESIHDFSGFQILQTKMGMFVNVHMPSRSTDSNRDFRYLLKINKIKNQIKNLSKDNDILVGGDFNENPFDNLMALNEGWCARRCASEMNACNGHILKFYNPFWKFLERDFSRQICGSIVASGSEPMKMAIFDQMLLCGNLVSKIKKVGFVENIKNFNISAFNQGHAGYHWPVYTILNI